MVAVLGGTAVKKWDRNSKAKKRERLYEQDTTNICSILTPKKMYVAHIPTFFVWKYN